MVQGGVEGGVEGGAGRMEGGSQEPRLAGYTVQRLLGRGTQGTVYKAISKTGSGNACGAGREVAVKVIEKVSLSRAGRDNLVTEIGLLKQLRHQFIGRRHQFRHYK